MEQLSWLRWPERAISLRVRDDGVGRAAGAQASGAIALQAFCREGSVTGGGEPVRSGAVAGGPGRRILCAEAARSSERFATSSAGKLHLYAKLQHPLIRTEY